MSYYLTIERKKGEYQPLKITSSSCFTRLSNLKENRVTLQEIDYYTVQFNNEEELKRLLLREGILAMSDINKKITIRRYQKGKYIKVMHDLLYQRDIEYIIDPKKLIKRVNDKLLNGDYRFIDRYANNYLKFYDCSSTAPEVRAYASDSIRNGICSKYFFELDKNGDNALVRMTKLLIYEYYQYENGKIIYKDKVKYRNLHSIIAFINNYDDKYLNNELENQEDLFNDVKKKVRKRTKKSELDGQMSLFE